MIFEIVKPRFEVLVPSSNKEGAWNVREYFDGLVNLIELAGRNCYKTENRISDTNSEVRDKFIKGIINRGHLSVIEHASVTARFVGSRSMSHQLVRHRLAAISQESQRYCNYSKEKFGDAIQVIRPLTIVDPSIERDEQGWDGKKAQGLAWSQAMHKAIESYEYLTKWSENVPPEDARSVLPNACKTEVVMTMNMRTWRHFFNMRCDKHAQWEIRALACGLLVSFKELIPVIFDDFDLEGWKQGWVAYPEDNWTNMDYTQGEIMATSVDAIPYLVERRPD